MSTIIKVTTPILQQFYICFFKKVIYTDSDIPRQMGTVHIKYRWIRLYIKRKNILHRNDQNMISLKILEDITKEWLMKVLHSTKAISRNTKISKLEETGQTGRLKEYADSTDETYRNHHRQ